MDVTTELSASRFHEPSTRQKKVFIMRVRDFLARRHKMKERGARRFPSPALPMEKGCSVSNACLGPSRCVPSQSESRIPPNRHVRLAPRCRHARTQVRHRVFIDRIPSVADIFSFEVRETCWCTTPGSGWPIDAGPRRDGGCLHDATDNGAIGEHVMQSSTSLLLRDSLQPLVSPACSRVQRLSRPTPATRASGKSAFL